MSDIKPTMILITSPWQGKKSFKLMPITKECPYAEGIYDLDGKVLVMMASNTKESIHLLPRLDENGDPMKTKNGPRVNGKTYKEQRVQLETNTEHYLIEKEEIEELINVLAVNAKRYDFKQYLNPVDLVLPNKKGKIEVVKG